MIGHGYCLGTSSLLCMKLPDKIANHKPVRITRYLGNQQQYYLVLVAYRRCCNDLCLPRYTNFPGLFMQYWDP